MGSSPLPSQREASRSYLPPRQQNRACHSFRSLGILQALACVCRRTAAESLCLVAVVPLNALDVVRIIERKILIVTVQANAVLLHLSERLNFCQSFFLVH